MKNSTKTVQTYPLGYTDYEDVRDEAFGAVGTPRRDQRELSLNADLLAERIKELRKRGKLTQTQLGERIGVQKAQISKFEKDAASISVGTMFKLLHALNATVVVQVAADEERLSGVLAG